MTGRPPIVSQITQHDGRPATYQLDGLETGAGPEVGKHAQNAWRDWCDDVHGEFRIEFRADSYRGHVVRQRTSDYQLVAWRSDSERVRREQRGIRRDPRGHYELFVPLDRELVVGESTPDRTLSSGDMVLLPIDSPFVLAHGDGAAALSLLIPYDRVDQRLGRTDRTRHVVARQGLSRVTRDLLVSALRHREELKAAEFDAVCDRAVDLYCLCAEGEERPPAGQAHLVSSAVRQYVRTHAADPHLTVAGMAQAIGWSTRYVQAVLADEGTTPRELIRRERLDLARVRLGSGEFAGRSVSDVAASVGFSSPSAFSSAFRRHFGLTPREVRAGSAGGSALSE